jgi:hypothetical protein
MPADTNPFNLSAEQIAEGERQTALHKASIKESLIKSMGPRDAWGKLINHDAKPRLKLDDPEGQVLNAILEYLALKKVWAWRVTKIGSPIRDRLGNVTGMKKSTLPAGHSDIAGILPKSGKALYIEVKAKGKKPKPEQYEFIEKVNACGGVGLWADDLDTVVQSLKPYL